MKELKQYGLGKSILNATHYVFGGLTPIPKIPIQRDLNWTPYLPTYEPQFGGGWDTYGCTVWGTQNAMEILLKRLTDKEYNFSERFNYILARIRPPGADPHQVMESIRSNGVINQDLLPMTTTIQEFKTPDPMETKYLVEGQRFPYLLKHEWLWNGLPSIEKRNELITEALQYSPVCVTVTAWFQEDGVYVDKGYPNTHWCVIFNKTNKGWEVFDSYDQSVKTLSFNHKIERAKRIYLESKGQQNWLYTIPVLKEVIKYIQKLLALKPIPLKDTKKTPSEQLVDIAVDKLGTDFTDDHVIPDDVSCVYALTTILHEQDPSIPIMSGTPELYKFMKSSPKFKEVTQPIKDMKAGYICISVTGTGNGSMPHGHCGLYQDETNIMSNSSISGKWETNFTRESWRNRYYTRGGYTTHIFEKAI